MPDHECIPMRRSFLVALLALFLPQRNLYLCPRICEGWLAYRPAWVWCKPEALRDGPDVYEPLRVG